MSLDQAAVTAVLEGDHAQTYLPAGTDRNTQDTAYSGESCNVLWRVI
jgi:hypothetical protein